MAAQVDRADGQAYTGCRELKHGLGLDHHEGRSFRGLHRHLTLVTAAHAFLALRRLHPEAVAEHSCATKS
jgi:SRSO17 transposase